MPIAGALISRKNRGPADAYALNAHNLPRTGAPERQARISMNSYQTILVHDDQSAESQCRRHVAIQLAREFNAQLVGVYLDDAPEITPSIAALLPNGIVAEHLRKAGEVQRAAEEAFRRAGGAAGLKDIEWRAPSGPPIDAAVAHGRCADLTVFGQPRPGETGSSFHTRLVAAALMETGRPILVVPYVGAPASIGASVLVAWDGGREASRALADAMPLLVRAKRVTVGCVDPGAAARGVDGAARERVAGYLRRHGVAARIETDNIGESDIAFGDWLLSRVADLGCDLIVMGGYGHPRWRERIRVARRRRCSWR